MIRIENDKPVNPVKPAKKKKRWFLNVEIACDDDAECESIAAVLRRACPHREIRANVDGKRVAFSTSDREIIIPLEKLDEDLIEKLCNGEWNEVVAFENYSVIFQSTPFGAVFWKNNRGNTEELNAVLTDLWASVGRVGLVRVSFDPHNKRAYRVKFDRLTDPVLEIATLILGPEERLLSIKEYFSATNDFKKLFIIK